MGTYTVVSGDTLSAISERFFGDYGQVDAIARLNNISDKDVIYPGMVLKLPESTAVATTQGPWGSIGGGLMLVGILAAGYFYYTRNKDKKPSTK